ncbi:MAG: tRNA lysidine(34) synthetase TilS [Treponema sp.]|jgi:tRNA(Ile)-lysidine synthase|nr:tRNA lysidine(34) synthetase TilS [Treponema sp.]
MNRFETAVYKNILSSVFDCGAEPKAASETVFIAAVSGGADSTAMLAALASLKNDPAVRFTLRCLHIEHGIRPAEESRGDARAVKALCKSLKVPCKTVYIPEGKIAHAASKFKMGIEAAARYYRHRIWNRELLRLGASRILAAHTRDDLLETILMRFIRGAGPAGLASMTLCRGNILRPVLSLNRSDVISYLEEKKLPYRIDSSNSDSRYLRNRVRHKLIPCLDEFFPFWRNALEFLGETQKMTAGFLSSEAGRRLPWKECAGGLQIPLEEFIREAGIIKEEAFFKAIDRLEAKKQGKRTQPGRTARRSSIRRFLKGLDSGIPAGDLGPVRAEKNNNCLMLKSAEKPGAAKGFSLLIKECGSYNLKKSFSIKVGWFEDFSKPVSGFCAARFYARLPLVFHSAEGRPAIGQKQRFFDMLKKYKGCFGKSITAEDSDGIAALIGTDKGKPVLLFTREELPVFYVIELLGV